MGRCQKASNTKHFVQTKRNDGPTAVRCEFTSPTARISLNQKEVMMVNGCQWRTFRSNKKKNDGVTAVNIQFNSSKRSIWFRAHCDCDVILENADVCCQRNSVWGSCSARLGFFVPSIRKEERGSDFENIDARWQKRDGQEFRLQFSRLLTRPLLGAPPGGPSPAQAADGLGWMMREAQAVFQWPGMMSADGPGAADRRALGGAGQDDCSAMTAELT